MKVYAKNNTLVCEPYELQNQNSNTLLIGIENCNDIAKIIDIDTTKTNNEDNYMVGDIIVYDTKYVKECVLCGKKYLMIPRCNVLAIIKEDE